MRVGILRAKKAGIKWAGSAGLRFFPLWTGMLRFSRASGGDTLKRILCTEIATDGCRYLIAEKRGELIRRVRGIGSAVPVDELEQSLKGFLGTDRIDEACLILSTEKTILRFADMPPLTGYDLEKAAKFLYRDFFPVQNRRYIFSHKTLKASSKGLKLLLAALPMETAEEAIDIFDRLGIRLSTIDTVESIADETFSRVEPVLFFAKQETTYRAYWVKSGVLQNAWRISNDPIAGPRELKAAFSELEEAGKIHNCVLVGEVSEWLAAACKKYDVVARESIDPYAGMEICARNLKSLKNLNLLPEKYKARNEKKDLLKKIALFDLSMVLAAVLLIAALSAAISSSQSLSGALDSQIRTMAAPIELKENEIKSDLGEVDSMREIIASLDWNNNERIACLEAITPMMPEEISIKQISQQDDRLVMLLGSARAAALTDFAQELRLSPQMRERSVEIAFFSERSGSSDMTIVVSRKVSLR
ncbi:MAG: hypothetical protein LBU32_26615 [Clostridiales bacterium]|jgi:hypothetical protein|nr:hypothetical protein [Clostridiales bacterium]